MEIRVTEGVCAKEIGFEIVDGIISKVNFFGGCDGNTKGLENLIVGSYVEDIIKKLEGIDCRGRGTSCPDQLAKILKKHLESK